MPRTVISLEPEDKEWLDRRAKRERVSMTEIVRRAIRRYRQESGNDPDHDIHELLRRSQGSWRGGDGLEYQDRIRQEWDNR